VIVLRAYKGDSMKRMSLGCVATAAMMALVSLATPALPQNLPPTEPILRIETGMHGAAINRIGVDAACRFIVTGSDDKTARLWELPENGVRDAKLLRVLRLPIGAGDAGKVYAVALSPDGRIVAAGGWVGEAAADESAFIFEAATGKIIRRLQGLNEVTNQLTFSPDGKFLAAALGGGGGVRVWETTDWSLVGEDRDYGGESSYGVAFDAAGRLYTGAYDKFLRRYSPDFKLEAKSKTFGGQQPYTVAVHPNGDRVAVGYADSTAVEVYGAKDLQRLFAADTAGVVNGNLGRVAWSADGARLYAGGKYSDAFAFPVRIWDQEGRGKGRNLGVTKDTIMQLLPCGDAIAVGALDPAFGLISASGEKRVWQEGAIPDLRNKLRDDFTVSGDGTKVRFGLGYGGNSPVLFDLTSGRLTDQQKPASGLSASETASLKISDWEDQVTPKVNGRRIELERYEISRSVAIAPGRDRFVLGTDWWLRAYNEDAKELWKKPVPGAVYGVNISRNSKFVVAAYRDGTIRWHRLSDGGEVVALFVHAKTREWVLWTPQGYYTSSVNGDQYVGWQLNKGWETAGEFVTAARLKKHLYRPDIVKRAFELADAEAAVREAGLSGFKLADLANHTPPEFRIVDPNDKTHADKSPVAVKLELDPTNDAVTGFNVTVNGRQVTTRDASDLDKPITAAGARTLNIPLEKGENHIQVAARNSVGDSVQDLLVYLDREGVLNKKGKLLILAIGVDKFEKLGSKYTLNYAGADAGLIVETLVSKAGALHTEVKPTLLVSNGVTPPTRANIEDALTIFREAGPEDTVVLFLAGHGVNEGPDYLFLAEDADFKDGHWRPSSTVNWLQLQHALQTAQGRRIMFVDTCHAGGAYNSRLIKDAADNNIIVFSATDEVTLAQERGALGHGVFTYALAKGINGDADMFKRGTINILPLASYVADEVKQITNGAQEPTYNLSGSKDFVLAAH
jgi:WD40 repeat protein